MTTALPTIVPTGYSATVADFTARTKVDRSGALRLVTGTVSVPATTATTTLIGLVPFNKGAKFSYGSRLYCGDMDTSTNVTIDVGYTYYDSTLGTSVPNAFVAAYGTVPQSAGIVEMTAVEGMTWTAAADGWIGVTIGGGATTTTASITFSVAIAYDPSGVTNP